MRQNVIFDNDVLSRLAEVLSELKGNKVFFLTDDNTQKLVLPYFNSLVEELKASVITIAPGDMNKNLSTVEHVWSELQKGGATRNSVVVNLGGGVVTDLGGFAAATFKRGIRFVNVPTTLLSAVDAAVGGKTGVNFGGLKNEIGVFCEAVAVLISTRFFGTLPVEEIKSGFAEMLKHGLLKGTDTYQKLLSFDFTGVDNDQFLDLLTESVNVKRVIVEQDPTEKGLRRALNLGHTAGHAFESMALERNKPVPHGYAVAWGLVVEAVLSNLLKGFPSEKLYGLAQFVYSYFGAFYITCDDYPALLDLIHHDKKSVSGECNFSLLKKIGEVEVDCRVDDDTVKAAFDVYRDLMHI